MLNIRNVDLYVWSIFVYFNNNLSYNEEELNICAN